MAVMGAQPAGLPPWQTIATLQMGLPEAIVIDLPASGASVRAAIPCDHTLPGIIGYLRTVELDPSASSGIVFVGGLNLFIIGC